MQITKTLNNFIQSKSIQEYINKCDFMSLYDDWLKLMTTKASTLTTFLFECGVDPFKYMNYIPDAAFKGCDWLTNYDIPKGIKIISYASFQNCSNLRNVTIPEGAEVIGSYAFDGCTNLQGIELPQSLQSIFYGAFDECKSLAGDIVIPAKTTEVTNDIFNNCHSLKRIICKNNEAFGVFQKEYGGKYYEVILDI